MDKRSKKNNISDKELDRDIVNLRLPVIDQTPPLSFDDFDEYDDEMRDWLEEDSAEVDK